MKVNGFFRHEPILACPADDGFLYITDGHTRWDAVQLANREGAGIEAVPVMLEEPGTTEEDRLFTKRQANSGRQLTQLGEAMLMKKMLGRGISEETIARRWPCSITTVRNALALLSAPTPVRDAVQAGEVSATEARKLVKKKGAGAVGHLQAAREAVKAAGKTKITPKVLKAVDGDAKPARSAKVDAPALPLGEPPAVTAIHPDDAAVDRFAVEMKAKLAAARAKGRGGWEQCAPADLSHMLREHVDKGDPCDVAIISMFLWCLGKQIDTASAGESW
jgi:ParB-like chromosome segregation protein Spo0J